jgi:hypothetical protein
VALVAAPTAGAASVEGGTTKVDFKTFINAKKLKFKTVNASPNTKTGGTFRLGSGIVTFNEQPSGNIGIPAPSELQFTLGKKKLSLTGFTIKLTSGKAALNAVVNKKGKAVTVFDIASQGKIGPDSKFTVLEMSGANMQLTKSGAAAINKAFGLTAPKRGQKDKRVKAKQKVGTMDLDAERSLTVVSGRSVTVYDTTFVDTLRSCDIELQAVAPATAIPTDPSSAPRGGVDLPINTQAGGTLTAATLIGQVNHLGGTRLFRPEPGQPGNTTGKAGYDSPIEDFRFSFGGNATALFARVLRSNNVLEIGTVEPPIPTAELRDTGGTVSLTGDLVLSATAAGTLAQKEPPLGADCPIPAGSKIGRATMTANVE